MKKITAFLSAVFIVLSFCACDASGNEPTTEDDELITSAQVNITSATLELVSPAKIKAGEQLTLTLRLTDCVWFTDMTLQIAYPSDTAEYVSGKTLFNIESVYDAVNVRDGAVFYSLMSQGAETLNGDCAKFVFTVGKDVPPGTVLEFSFAPESSYCAAYDALGVNTENLSELITFTGCSVTVE